MPRSRVSVFFLPFGFGHARSAAARNWGVPAWHVRRIAVDERLAAFAGRAELVWYANLPHTLTAAFGGSSRPEPI